MTFKVVANTVAVTTTAAEVTDSRFLRIYNSNTTIVANVQIGANSSSVSSMITVGPTQIVFIDLGPMNPQYDVDAKWISLAGASATVYRTPISNG
jgi:hypothetical protein